MAANGLRGQDFAPAFTLEHELATAADLLDALEILLETDPPQAAPAVLSTLAGLAGDALARARDAFEAVAQKGGAS